MKMKRQAKKKKKEGCVGRRIKGREGRKEKKSKVEGVCGERGEEIIIGEKHEEKKNGKEEEKKRKKGGRKKRKRGKGKRKCKEYHAVSRPRRRRTRNCATRARFPPTPIILHLRAT